jgi:hypothetical protein
MFLLDVGQGFMILINQGYRICKYLFMEMIEKKITERQFTKGGPSK